MKNQKSFLLFLGVLIVLSAVLGACGPQPLEQGSILVCPKHFEPGVSQCKEKEYTTDEVKLDEDSYPAVLLTADQIAVYKKNIEVYDIYRGAGYHPVPSDFGKVYTVETLTIMADIDPAACGGTYNESTCLGPKKNIVLKGQVKFESSYTISLKLKINDQKAYELAYEAGGEQALLKLFNERSRDIFQNSGDLDPQDWLNLTLTKESVAENWKNKLLASDYMTSWKYYPLFDLENAEIVVRYFEPMKIDDASDTQSEAIKQDQEFQEFLSRRDQFCGEFPAGSQERLECYATFVCYEVKCEALVNDTKIILDAITLEPTPVVTETP